jgi:hypothetical protein
MCWYSCLLVLNFYVLNILHTAFYEVVKSSNFLFTSTNLTGNCDGHVTPHKDSSTRSEICISRHRFFTSTHHGNKIITGLVILL